MFILYKSQKMRYSFFFVLLTVKTYDLLQYIDKNVMKRLKMGRKAKKWDEWNKFLAKKN